MTWSIDRESPTRGPPIAAVVLGLLLLWVGAAEIEVAIAMTGVYRLIPST